jgi:uncharacterized protein YjdB
MSFRFFPLLVAVGVLFTSCDGPTEPTQVSSVQVTAPTTTLASGASLQLTAVARSSGGETLAGRTITWSSSNQTVATVSATGVVTAGHVLGGSAESAIITASSEGIAGTVALSVTPVQAARLEMNLDSLMLRVGDSLGIGVRIVGAGGIALLGRNLEWKTLDSTVARVSSAGTVSAINIGNARYRSTRIVVTHQQLTDTAIIVAKPLAPLLTLSTTDTLVRVGQSATLSWVTHYATSCTGTGPAQSATGTEGELVIRPDSGGRRWAQLHCVGDGGAKQDSLRIVTPFPTYLTSHENEISYVITTRQIAPTLTEPSPVCGPDRLGVGNARAYADFLQDGSITLVANPLRYFSGNTAVPGPICFLLKNSDGTWTDITQTLLDDTVGCVHSRRALVSDLNGDTKPDVFFACHGAEGEHFPELPGESSMYLLSSPQGKYRKIVLPLNAYSHGASIGDVNKDGRPDVLLLHASIPSSPFPYIALLMNTGDGSLRREDERFPLVIQHNPYTTELLDINEDGNIDAVIAMFDAEGVSAPPPTRIYWGTAAGTFDLQNPQDLPKDLSCPATLHITKHLSNLYMFRVCNGYSDNIVQRVRIGSWTTQVIWSERGPYLGWGRGTYAWLDWLHFKDGFFIHDRVPALRITP